jgi:hypothetical protein
MSTIERSEPRIDTDRVADAVEAPAVSESKIPLPTAVELKFVQEAIKHVHGDPNVELRRHEPINADRSNIYLSRLKRSHRYNPKDWVDVVQPPDFSNVDRQKMAWLAGHYMTHLLAPEALAQILVLGSMEEFRSQEDQIDPSKARLFIPGTIFALMGWDGTARSLSPSMFPPKVPTSTTLGGIIIPYIQRANPTELNINEIYRLRTLNKEYRETPIPRPIY